MAIDFTDAIREMVEYMKANPEYRAKVEKAGREFAEILEQSDKDFEAIRNGTYKPKGIVICKQTSGTK